MTNYQAESSSSNFVPVVLVFFMSENKILLGYKKRGFGRGKIVGIGGHVEVGESFFQAACRESREEVSLNPQELDVCARLNFIFPTKAQWNMKCRVYKTYSWVGTLSESDEIKPQWFEVDNLPFGQMWDDAKTWMSYILGGHKIEANIVMDDDNEHVDFTDITIVS